MGKPLDGRKLLEWPDENKSVAAHPIIPIVRIFGKTRSSGEIPADPSVEVCHTSWKAGRYIACPCGQVLWKSSRYC